MYRLVVLVIAMILIAIFPQYTQPLFKVKKTEAIVMDYLIFEQNLHQEQLNIKAKHSILDEQVAFYYESIEGKLSKDILQHLVREANKNDVPPEILIKLLKTESNFNPNLIGPLTRFGHAYGMAQFMENTAPWIADMANLDYKKELLFEPEYAISLAATYLNYLQYGDGGAHEGYQDWHATLTAYNRGMGGLNTYQQRYQTVQSSFSKKIISQAEVLMAEQQNHNEKLNTVSILGH